MNQDYVCKYCGSKFHREKTLATHVCTKKRRFIDSESTGPRLGFRTFQKFHEITTNTKKQKTLQEFIDNRYYIDFVKFGNYLALLKPLYMDEFISYLIRNGIKMREWTSDHVYYCYIQELIKTEPTTAALERTITEIMSWCDKNSVKFNDFFREISSNEAAHMIYFGKISPWVLYLSSTGGELLQKFNEDHAKMVGIIIDPGFWMKKFKKNSDDVEYIRQLLTEAGI